MKNYRIAILVAAVVAFAGGPALAELIGTVTVDYVGPGPKMDLPVVDTRTGMSGSYYTGVYKLDLSGATAYTDWLRGQVQSFCIDTDDSSSTDPHLYGIVELFGAPDQTAGPMGDIKARHLAELLDENWAWKTTITSSLQAAAIQLSVWEIVADTTYDLSTGSFYLNSSTLWDAGEVGAVAQAMLNNISATGHDYIDRYVAVSHPILTPGTQPTGEFQDYIVRVPLPGAVLLGLLGLSVAGAKLRKRSA